jgi:hypothetical protein
MALVVLAGASLGAQAQQRTYEERYDDPPAATRAVDNLGARSLAPHIVVGPYVSVQVNVDMFGNNIVGDAANEPSIAVNPADPDNIVIGWRQFDSITSNFRQGGWGFSRDGGQTWEFPGVLEPGVFRSDPVLDASSDGVFLYQSLQEDFDVDVFRSLDGGASWPQRAPEFGGDKNWMVVDSTRGMGDGHVYGTWQRFFGCCGSRTLTRSINVGESFQQPVEVALRPLFGTMDVGPDGALYIAGIEGTVTQDFDQFVIARSDNAQNPAVTPTFTGFRVNMGGSMRLGATPNPDGLLGQANVAVDPGNGNNVYMVASVDPPGSDPMDVHFIRSTDRGQTWSAPVRVNDDPAGNGAWQWFAAHSVAPNGRIDVIWNDTRASTNPIFSELYYAWSNDGGVTWSENVPVSPQFNSRLGYPRQSKIGDYYTIVSDETGANVAYSATFNGEQDVYFVRVFPDCNQDGSSDVVNIATGTSADANGNREPDECEAVTLSPPVPGIAGQENSITASGATAHGNVLFIFSLTPGEAPVTGCPGLTWDVATARPLGAVRADATGTATLTRRLPAGFAGRTVLFQALDRATCQLSNRVDALMQ